jgi:hypothetical protein
MENGTSDKESGIFFSKKASYCLPVKLFVYMSDTNNLSPHIPTLIIMENPIGDLMEKSHLPIDVDSENYEHIDF